MSSYTGYYVLGLSFIMVLVLLLAAGCTAPIAVRALSLTANGASYITTKKSLSDHGLSYVLDHDCAILRVTTNEPICKEK
jgi:hypothetical protein